MTEMQKVGLGMIAVGGFLVAGVVFQWSWFVNSRKYRRMADLVGERAPAIFYGLLGGLILVFGILGALGIWRGALDFGAQ